VLDLLTNHVLKCQDLLVYDKYLYLFISKSEAFIKIDLMKQLIYYDESINDFED